MNSPAKMELYQRAVDSTNTYLIVTWIGLQTLDTILTDRGARGRLIAWNGCYLQYGEGDMSWPISSSHRSSLTDGMRCTGSKNGYDGYGGYEYGGAGLGSKLSNESRPHPFYTFRPMSDGNVCPSVCLAVLPASQIQMNHQRSDQNRTRT